MHQSRTISGDHADSVTTADITTTTYNYPCDTCPGCNGRGWQENNDGIRVICPMCGGTGCWKKCTSYYSWEPCSKFADFYLGRI